MLVADILYRGAGLHPDRPAVWFDGEWRTYGELGRSASVFGRFLLEGGVRTGDRVALLLDNSFDYVIAHFGVLGIGAVEVSLNTDLRAADLMRLIEDCEAAALVAGPKYRRTCAELLPQLPRVRLFIGELPDNATNQTARSASLSVALMGAPAGVSTAVRAEDDLASIVYTSGSTGRPKGVMLSHRNLVSNMRSIVGYLKLSPEDRMMVVLPFHYIYGRSLLYTHLMSGGSVVIDNRFAFPAAVLQTMAEQEVTCFAGVPSTFSILLRKTDVARRRFPTLRLLTQAGGALTPALQREVTEVFHPAKLCVMYGSTEAAPRISYLEPDLLPAKWGSIGRAIPGVEIRIVDELGAAVPRGTIGEVTARGPNIMLGYWKDPAGTGRVLRNGFYHTGDLGYEDRDGCIFLTGRSTDIIKVGGNRVSATEIEEHLLAQPGVIEAAVVGLPDELLGEAIEAFVVVQNPGPERASLLEALKRRLPTYKLPRNLSLVTELPKNQAGKILKPLLKERRNDFATNTETQSSANP